MRHLLRICKNHLLAISKMEADRRRNCQRYEQDAAMVYEDTLRFAGYAIGACFLESLLTKDVKWKEKCNMVIAGGLGAFAYHFWLKRRWSRLTQPHTQSPGSAQQVYRRQ